ncbi:MAG: sigma-70 region 2 domain protein [Nocardioides sp.]|nr:sigma-70 region 2 domain protein [Nocardioides sp.]
MSQTLPRIDGPGDAELISAVRGGDVDAYGELFARHVDAARRLGRQLVSGPDVDDLVSEAFAKVLAVLQRGGGPDLAFRAYLLTAVRRLHVDKIRGAARLHTTDDLTPFDPGVPFRDTAVEGFENSAAARAFASLPERWQLVLWHTEVEGQKPADVAPLLGMSANSVSALAYRAREGLRQAFVTMHVQSVDGDAECDWTHQHLGPYIRKGVSRRDANRVESHLDGCRKCMAIYLELSEVNSNLSGILAPLLLGGAAAAYVASAGGGTAVSGGLLFLLGRARDVALANAPVTAVAGVAATAVIAGSVFVAVEAGHDRSPEASGGAPTTAASASPTPGAGRRSDRTPDDRTTRRPRPSPEAPAVLPPAVPTDRLPTEVLAPSLTSPPSPDATPTFGHETPTPTHPVEPQPPRMDLGVTARATSSDGVAFQVEVTVTGLAQGGSATLAASTDATSVGLTLDPRCTLVQLGAGSCAVSSTPTTFTFVVGTLADAPVTLTFRVSPDAPGIETHPADNTTRLVLKP